MEEKIILKLRAVSDRYPRRRAILNSPFQQQGGIACMIAIPLLKRLKNNKKHGNPQDFRAFIGGATQTRTGE